jgi:hypothetical protein
MQVPMTTVKPEAPMCEMPQHQVSDVRIGWPEAWLSSLVDSQLQREQSEVVAVPLALASLNARSDLLLIVDRPVTDPAHHFRVGVHYDHRRSVVLAPLGQELSES